MLLRLLRPAFASRIYAHKYVYPPALLPFQYNSNNQQRSHKNFGHKNEKTPLASRIWYTILLIGIIAPNLNYTW